MDGAAAWASLKEEVSQKLFLREYYSTRSAASTREAAVIMPKHTHTIRLVMYGSH